MVRPRFLIPPTLLALLVALGGCAPHPPRPAAKPAPLDAPERRRQAESLRRSGETFAAIQQLQIARQIDGGTENDLLVLAGLYNSLGEAEEADALLSGAARSGASPALCLALAETRSKMGDFAGAADALQPLLPRAAALDPPTRQLMARTLLLAGDAARAAPLLPARTADPEWLALRGFSELVQDQPRSAVRDFARAVTANPRDGWNAFLLGLAARSSGDPARAISAWTGAAALPDAPSEAVLDLAQLLAAQGRADRSIVLLRRIRNDDRKSPAYWAAVLAVERAKHHPVAAALARGYALFNDGDPWQAEAIWRKALAQARGDDAKEVLAALHNSAFKRLDPAAALRYATEATRRWPDDPYFHRRRAEVLLGENRMREAEAEATALQRTAPPDQAVETAELLCRIALDAGQPDILSRNAARYRQLQPSAPDPLLHLAEWQAQQGRSPENLEKTLALYRQAQQLDPKSADATAQVGLLLADLNRPQEAIPVLLRALTLWPRVLEGTPHARLAELYQRMGRTAEARFHAAQYQKLRRIKERWPILLKALRTDRPIAEWEELGELALLRRENWIALCAFQHVVGQAPKDPAAWRSLAAVYKRLGYFEEALNAVMRARRLAPEKAPL